MFTLANEGKVWWRVNLVARTEEDGEPKDVPVLILYRVYKRSELKARERALNKSVATMTKAVGEARGTTEDVEDIVTKSMREVETIEAETMNDLVARVCDWKQIIGPDGEPLKFSKALLKSLLEDEPQYQRVMAGLREASKGAHAKNSSPGPAGVLAPGQS